MRIRIALALLILISFGQASALPTTQIDNLEPTQVAVTTSEQPVQTENPQPSTEQPKEAPQPVAVQSEVKSVPPPSDPRSIAKATLIDLGLGDAWYAVEYIGFKESSWNPTAINSIGACGLFQALPCSKMNCNLSDVACQVRWATNYATQRYGSWHQAYTAWIRQGWW